MLRLLVESRKLPKIGDRQMLTGSPVAEPNSRPFVDTLQAAGGRSAHPGPTVAIPNKYSDGRQQIDTGVCCPKSCRRGTPSVVPGDWDRDAGPVRYWSGPCPP